VATDDVRFDPVGPVFEFLERSSTRGVAWAWARRDLDMAAAPAARRELTALLAAVDEPDWVLVHLGVTCFVDLHGLRVLVDVGAQLRVRGGELVVVEPPRCLQIMIEVTGLGTEISLVPTAVPHRVPTREGHR
jgi:anti-anti-sigma factor